LIEQLEEELTRRFYREEFKGEIGRLEGFVGCDLSGWRLD